LDILYAQITVVDDVL